MRYPVPRTRRHWTYSSLYTVIPIPLSIDRHDVTQSLHIRIVHPTRYRVVHITRRPILPADTTRSIKHHTPHSIPFTLHYHRHLLHLVLQRLRYLLWQRHSLTPIDRYITNRRWIDPCRLEVLFYDLMESLSFGLHAQPGTSCIPSAHALRRTLHPWLHPRHRLLSVDQTGSNAIGKFSSISPSLSQTRRIAHSHA